MSEETTPVLVGAGQVLQQDVEPRDAAGPLDLMQQAARAAAEDAGAGKALLEAIDTLAVVNVLCWDSGDAPRLLAEALGINPARRIYSTIGGNTPQALVTAMADRIAAGEAGTVLVAGSEAFHTGRAAHRAGIELGWPIVKDSRPEGFGDDRLGLDDTESRCGFQQPTQVYPAIETALRAASGKSAAEHALDIGRLYAPFTKVAAANPYAWFRDVRSAEEIAEVSEHNRYVGYPYTKRMNAIMMVDQAAAVIMTSAANARRLGIDPATWVYPVAGADAHDHWYFSDRPDFTRSPAIHACAQAAYEMAEVGPENIEYADIYSCFPCAVQIAYRETGLEGADFIGRTGRALTLTGGLAYHGGAGNNYAMHGITEAMRRVRENPGIKAMVTGVGWFMTKHSVGIYASEPCSVRWARADPSAVQRRVDAGPLVSRVEHYEGVGHIEAYTVMFDRASQAKSALIVGRTGKDVGTGTERFLAVADTDAETVAALIENEGVGSVGRARIADGINRFVLV